MAVGVGKDRVTSPNQSLIGLKFDFPLCISTSSDEDECVQGRIKWFDYSKGFGFVTPQDGSPDAFIHESELSPTDLRPFSEGEAVEFEIVAARLGPAAVNVRRIDALMTGSPVGDSAVSASTRPLAPASGDVFNFLNQNQRIVLNVDSMSEEQKQTLLSWGMHMYGLGQHRVANIEAIKYDGRLIVLDDGSRWEVKSSDHLTASIWSEYEQVVIIDDKMFLLNESEAIDVEEEA